jgi:hypothetical protein
MKAATAAEKRPVCKSSLDTRARERRYEGRTKKRRPFISPFQPSATVLSYPSLSLRTISQSCVELVEVPGVFGDVSGSSDEQEDGYQVKVNRPSGVTLGIATNITSNNAVTSY